MQEERQRKKLAMMSMAYKRKRTEGEKDALRFRFYGGLSPLTLELKTTFEKTFIQLFLASTNLSEPFILEANSTPLSYNHLYHYSHIYVPFLIITKWENKTI